jgi:hypothetical protein
VVGVMNPDTWGTDIATGADFEDMHEQGGPIVQITSSGLVFSRRRSRGCSGRATRRRCSAFTTLELGRGAFRRGRSARPGLCRLPGRRRLFHPRRHSAHPIGTGKVDQWFADNADNSKIDLMRSGYDPVHRCVNWAFTELGQTANSAILSSASPRRWTLIRKAMQEIAASATLPATIESMPTPDTDPISWDDASRAGKKPVLAGIDSANTYGTFTGTPLASTIVTGDYQASPGRRSFVSGVPPLVDAAGVQVALGVKSQATKDALVWNPASSLDVDGVCHQRADARYARFKQTTVAGETWTRSKGLEVDLSEAGER